MPGQKTQREMQAQGSMPSHRVVTAVQAGKWRPIMITRSMYGLMFGLPIMFGLQTLLLESHATTCGTRDQGSHDVGDTMLMSSTRSVTQHGWTQVLRRQQARTRARKKLYTSEESDRKAHELKKKAQTNSEKTKSFLSSVTTWLREARSRNVARFMNVTTSDEKKSKKNRFSRQNSKTNTVPGNAVKSGAGRAKKISERNANESSERNALAPETPQEVEPVPSSLSIDTPPTAFPDAAPVKAPAAVSGSCTPTASDAASESSTELEDSDPEEKKLEEKPSCRGSEQKNPEEQVGMEKSTEIEEVSANTKMEEVSLNLKGELRAESGEIEELSVKEDVCANAEPTTAVLSSTAVRVPLMSGLTSQSENSGVISSASTKSLTIPSLIFNPDSASNSLISSEIVHYIFNDCILKDAFQLLSLPDGLAKTVANCCGSYRSGNGKQNRNFGGTNWYKKYGSPETRRTEPLYVLQIGQFHYRTGLCPQEMCWVDSSVPTILREITSWMPTVNDPGRLGRVKKLEVLGILGEKRIMESSNSTSNAEQYQQNLIQEKTPTQNTKKKKLDSKKKRLASLKSTIKKLQRPADSHITHNAIGSYESTFRNNPYDNVPAPNRARWLRKYVTILDSPEFLGRSNQNHPDQNEKNENHHNRAGQSFHRNYSHHNENHNHPHQKIHKLSSIESARVRKLNSYYIDPTDENIIIHCNSIDDHFPNVECPDPTPAKETAKGENDDPANQLDSNSNDNSIEKKHSSDPRFDPRRFKLDPRYLGSDPRFNLQHPTHLIDVDYTVWAWRSGIHYDWNNWREEDGCIDWAWLVIRRVVVKGAFVYYSPNWSEMLLENGMFENGEPSSYNVVFVRDEPYVENSDSKRPPSKGDNSKESYSKESHSKEDHDSEDSEFEHDLISSPNSINQQKARVSLHWASGFGFETVVYTFNPITLSHTVPMSGKTAALFWHDSRYSSIDPIARFDWVLRRVAGLAETNDIGKEDIGKKEGEGKNSESSLHVGVVRLV